MSTTAICTDSSALLPAGSAEELGISIVPLAVTLDGESFDEHTGDLEDFYARLEQGAEAKTSQPNPAAFAYAYAEAAERGKEHVLSIHLDGRISGTSLSAGLAADEAQVPVTVVDTQTVSFGVGVCVRAAASALADGAPPAEAAGRAASVGAGMQNAFVARAGPQGRVPGQRGWTVLTYVNGLASPLAACNSIDAAIELMTARVADERRPVTAAVGHAGSTIEEAAATLAAEIGQVSQVETIERYRVGPSVGAHTGPTSFGVFWWPRAA